jgi:4-amino-4-deoxy-L-arabinose transferase-like glycosyltransferase
MNEARSKVSAVTPSPVGERLAEIDTSGARTGRIQARVKLIERHRLLVTLITLLAVAFGLRAVAYIEAPRSLAGAGLTAKQGEIARNIVDHGRWFVVNQQALDLLKQRQAEQQRLVDPETVDFSIADSESAAEPMVDQMPGVGLVLAGLWWSTGSKTYAPIQWLQIVLDAAMVLLIYWIGMRLTRSTRIALIAALLYAFWAGAIVVAKRPSLDTWAGFFTIGCVAAFIWARERPASRWRLVPFGLLIGAGIYFRPFIVLLPIALALVATPGGGWKRRLVWMGVPTATALLVLAPWTIRNYYEFDRFIPTRTGLGQAVFEGTGQARSDEETASIVREKRPGAKYGSPTYDDFLISASVRAIIDDPGWYLQLVRERSRFLLPCLLVVLVWRRWRSAALIPVAAAAATVVPYIFIGGDTRFYLPAAFAYFILIAMTVEAAALMLVRLRTRRSVGSAEKLSRDPSAF